MSLNSSATSSGRPATLPATCAYLERSLALLARERPENFRRFCAALRGLRVHIQVDDERFTVVGDGLSARVQAGARGEAVAEFTVRRSALLEVIDGRRTLAEALARGELGVRGPLPRLHELRAALLAYVHGAVRCRAFPALLERYREMQ